MKVGIDNGKRRSGTRWRPAVALTVSASKFATSDGGHMHITAGLTEYDIHSRRESVSLSLDEKETEDLITRLQAHLEWLRGAAE